ncbi:ATP-binding protein [Herbiconiux sp. KACC 21604]|uniref:sensor histidine kinase n=1 Tax=unclassified Herbiconiux TaxID=2618217 RepID=UPI0014924796|nr:ATP-binding protein [Herbiconiux sp. SALV-R1]QJU54723.1 HAMP domain-containing protein [Herbiconiux sp. SALV-R1]WPO85827.1 ATP-binding protein [Herbiconiux sp. KACC 21604]
MAEPRERAAEARGTQGPGAPHTQRDRGHPRRPRTRPRTLRGRITLITTLVMAAAVALGGSGFAVALSLSLHQQAVQAAETELDRVESLLERQGPTALAETDGWAQLLREGTVVAASEDLDDTRPLVDTDDGSTDPDDLLGRTVPVPGDDDRLVLAAGSTDDGLLVVGVDDGVRADAVATTIVLLAIAAPLLVALMAVITFVSVGRALRPVDRIRAATDGITADDLGRRLDVPQGSAELARLATTMNRMLARLDEAQSRQRRFVSDASHELRSPLSALRQTAEVARDYPGTLPPDRLAHTVAEESERMAALVDGLLLLTRADEGALRPDAHEVDLDDLVLAEAARLRAAHPGLRIDTSGVGAARVRGDSGMLGRMLRNLGDNAARHARTTVALGCRGVDGRAEVRVADDGSGIPVADRERVFERFVRLDESRSRDAGGSGLGLAIVASIVRAHAGTVSITDDEPAGGGADVASPGTVFSVVLPAV